MKRGNKPRQTTLKSALNKTGQQELGLDLEGSPEGNSSIERGPWVEDLTKYFDFLHSTKGEDGRLKCTMECKLCRNSSVKNSSITVTDKSGYAFVRHLKVSTNKLTIAIVAFYFT